MAGSLASRESQTFSPRLHRHHAQITFKFNQVLLSERKRLSRYEAREPWLEYYDWVSGVGMGRAITTPYKRLRKRNRCTSMTVGA
jgi:hypothetical protein